MTGGLDNTLPTLSVTPAYYLTPVTFNGIPGFTPASRSYHRFNTDDGVADDDTAAMDPDRLSRLRGNNSDSSADTEHRNLNNRQRWKWKGSNGFHGFSSGGGATTTNSTYKPAEVRTAYSMPALAAASDADQGAGQTIYVITAYHAPNITQDLATFSTQFGLANCPSLSGALPVSTTLPLPAAGAACQFNVAYATADGNLNASAPTYNASWAMEATLDVSWVHATASKASIVLIEAADNSLASMVGAIKLANRMGPGVVSMSFAVPEGSWIAAQESLFSTANMAYLAASGDNGSEVNWPAVSAGVIAVGGTTLSWDGTTRTEYGWSGSGGGVSAHLSLPTYQTGVTVNSVAMTHRSVPDVALNADPRSGQYVYFTNQTGQGRWTVVGGTSLATPQWAGLVAVVNARKSVKHTSSQFLSRLYLSSMASSLWDIATGSDTSSFGVCAVSCVPLSGYDLVTGLGSPKVTNLLAAW